MRLLFCLGRGLFRQAVENRERNESRAVVASKSYLGFPRENYCIFVTSAFAVLTFKGVPDTMGSVKALSEFFSGACPPCFGDALILLFSNNTYCVEKCSAIAHLDVCNNIRREVIYCHGLTCASVIAVSRSSRDCSGVSSRPSLSRFRTVSPAPRLARPSPGTPSFAVPLIRTPTAVCSPCTVSCTRRFSLSPIFLP